MKTESEIRHAAYLLADEAARRDRQNIPGRASRGGMAMALLHDPQVLVLDEPTSGLDPNQVHGVRELIRSLGKTKTLLLSTHILQEVEAVCDRVILINNGRIVLDGSVDEMKGSQQDIEARFRELTTSS